MRKILVATTFREFDGGVNSKIQIEFIKSLKEQTYKNFLLVVTNFQEKTVLDYLEKEKIEFVFFQSALKEFKYSWSEVVQNVFSVVERGEHIVLWTNCDNIFSSNFLEEVINNFQPYFGGITWPMMSYNSFDDFRADSPLSNKILTSLDPFGKVQKNSWSNIYENKLYESFKYMIKDDTFYSYDPKEWISDCFFIDGDCFLDDKKNQMFISHKLDGRFQGIAQIMFLAFFAKNWINIIYKAQASSIRNHRIEKNTALFKIKKSSTPTVPSIVEINNKIIKSFLNNTKMSRYYDRSQYYFSKYNLHKDFKVVGTKVQKIYFFYYLIVWKIYHIVYRVLCKLIKFNYN